MLLILGLMFLNLKLCVAPGILVNVQVCVCLPGSLIPRKAPPPSARIFNPSESFSSSTGSCPCVSETESQTSAEEVTVKQARGIPTGVLQLYRDSWFGRCGIPEEIVVVPEDQRIVFPDDNEKVDISDKRIVFPNAEQEKAEWEMRDRERRLKKLSRRPRVAPSIVGGRDADYIYPWMVAFVRKGLKVASIYCGGALVTKKHVITAGHCFHSVTDLTVLSARIRAYDINRPKYAVGLKSALVHPKYDTREHYNDIAIVTLENDVRSPHPICIPIEDTVGVDEPNAKAQILGYGNNKFGGTTSEILQLADVTVFSNDRCNASYGKLNSPSLSHGIDETQLCAGRESGGVDACQHDSGGPLMNDNELGVRLLIGVVSFGNKCAEPGFPGVYTRIKEFLPWIFENIS